MERTCDVVIVGGGPTGLMLAAELRLWGVDVVVLERDAVRLPVIRSLGLHARSIEILDQRGLLDAFLEAGTRYPMRVGFAGIDAPAPADLDTAHPFLLGIPQTITDRLLEEHAAASGAEVRRGAEVASVTQDAEVATAVLAGGDLVRGAFLVGADGGRSAVRRAAGIPFEGDEATTSWLLGEVRLDVDAPEALAVSAAVRERDRAFGIGPAGDGWFRLVVREDAPRAGGDVTIGEIRTRLRAVAGTDLGAHSPRWTSRFSDAARVAARYRDGRILLAGDAAHVHAALGGQGLGLGVRDAVNLGFKLAAEVKGWAPPELLDTYGAERKPVAETVLRNTRVQSDLLRTDAGAEATRGLLTELAAIPAVARRLIEAVTAIGIRYDVGGPDGDEVVGRRLRDIPVEGGRLYERMRDGRGVLVDSTGALAPSGYADRLRVAAADADEHGAPAVLLRPDGHIVWRGDDAAGLDAALRRWFGAPSRD